MKSLPGWIARFQQVLRESECPSADSIESRSARSIEPLEDRNLLANGVVANYVMTQDWGSGFQAQIQLNNQQSSNINNWTVEFDFAANITSIWDAKITSHVGNHYVITNAGWNTTLSASGSVSFGFVASPGNTTARPTNLKLNGVPLDGSNVPNPSPSISIGDISMSEGNSGRSDAVFKVKLSSPATSAVTVQFSTANNTAAAGSDYDASSGTLYFAAGESEKSITVKVIGDSQVEANESFLLNLSNATGATISDGQAVGTINNDDVSAPTGNFQFSILDNWVSGFTGEIRAKNTTGSTIKDWRLEFDYSGSISSIWNASIVSHVGNRYVIKAPEWAKDIAAGASASFGFSAGPASAPPPVNYVLKSAGATTPGTPNRAPIAVNDSVVTTTSQAVTIDVLQNDSDPDGNSLSISATSRPAHGSVTRNQNGTLTYTPLAGYVGSDLFTYTVIDGKGGTANGSVSITVAARANWPAQVFAPYVDMTLYPMYNLVTAAQNSGVRFFTLAFIVADPTNQPSWGGYSVYGVGSGDFDAAVKQQLTSLRAMGGDVMISFGGAANHELAEVITDVNALKNAYQKVIDAYSLRVIDFDIEGGAVADHASIDRRSQAIALLQRDAVTSGKTLDVHFTLPVLPSGLTNDGLYVLQSALRYGVNISVVNIMAMDYGDSAAPNPQGKMGDYAIAAATSLFQQLQGLYGSSRTEAQLWGMVGVTPMIGLNDVTTETFDQQEAAELLAFAKQKKIALLSMWSLNRDQQNSSGKINYVDNNSSSLLQSSLEFSKLFNGFLL